jgi:hypothetical protein
VRGLLGGLPLGYAIQAVTIATHYDPGVRKSHLPFFFLENRRGNDPCPFSKEGANFMKKEKESLAA